MAKRYSGNLQISVTYDDRNFYRTAVSRGGKLLWRGTVNPAPAGFGPGIAYDSPQAYDEVASSALAFAHAEIGGIGDEAEFDENLTGYLIRRSPHAKGSSHATPHAKGSSHATPHAKGSSHATRKSTARRPYQYRAAVVGKGLLIGGGKRHVSSWFNTKKEADDWAWTIKEGNEAAKRPVAFVTIERRDGNAVELVSSVTSD
jgi:hypothetical protein